jgi:hypothetical protein
MEEEAVQDGGHPDQQQTGGGIGRLGDGQLARLSGFERRRHVLAEVRHRRIGDLSQCRGRHPGELQRGLQSEHLDR